MLFLEQSAILALVVTAILAGVNLVRFPLNYHSYRSGLVGGLVVFTILIFFANWTFVWMVLYWGRPALNGPLHGYIFMLLPAFVGWAGFLVFDIFVGGSISLDRDSSYNSWNRENQNVTVNSSSFGVGLFLVPIAMLVVTFIFVSGTKWAPFGDTEAKALAHLVTVTKEDENSYPDADVNHIVLVPEDTAVFKSNNVIASEKDDQGRNLGSLYQVGAQQLQSVNNHLYWISALDFNGWRTWKQTAVGDQKQVSPGYIVVDAEDPNAEPTIRTSFKMKCTPSAYFGSDLQRRIYDGGYQNYKIDDLTIEVDDNWKPWYTAAIDKPVIHGVGSVPVGMIMIDPETCEITRYDLDEIPDWVDRVYSASTAKAMMGWWGNWNDAPWKWCCYSNGGRSKVSGEPVLVYTAGSQHPQWQMTMTSKSKDTSIIAVVLFDARSANARYFEALSGSPIESAVLKTFTSTNKNLKNFEPKHISLHKIYGEETWVVSYVAQQSDSNVPGEPFQAVGLLQVRDVEGANVVFSTTKEDALSQYKQVLSRPSSNAAPTEEKRNSEITGTIKEIASQIENGKTVYLILLNEDHNHVYKAGADVSVELAFAKSGDRVTLSYFETQGPVRDTGQFNDLALPFIQ